MSLSKCFEIAIRLADAVSAAHEKGITHDLGLVAWVTDAVQQFSHALHEEWNERLTGIGRIISEHEIPATSIEL